MLIEELTMEEFSAGLEATRTVIVPFGATEAHGVHLPLATDTLMAQDVCRKAALRRPLFVAPAVPYGVCRSTGSHPGTLSISTATLRALCLDIGHALIAQGLRNLVLLTGHAGGTHGATLIDAGEELLARHPGIRVAVLTEYQLAKGRGQGLIETAGDSHAGEIETSRILHAHPELVKGEGVREFPSFPEGMLVRNKRRFWPGAVWGDPTKASAEKGRKIEELVVDALLEFLDAFESFREDAPDDFC